MNSNDKVLLLDVFLKNTLAFTKKFTNNQNINSINWEKVNNDKKKGKKVNLPIMIRKNQGVKRQ